MATKKQKREAAQAKREKWLEDIRLSGLKAQMEDRERRLKNKLQKQNEKTMEVAEDE